MVAQTNIQLPTALVQELEAQAAKVGLSLAAYIAFMTRVRARRHDEEFERVAKQLFSKYPEALRKLAQ
ncbi:MAG: hypothetical protein JNM80_07585 [Phycisphaerae bacterium]|nr:hypothetical protein [Phycisphaerae bacterium]